MTRQEILTNIQTNYMFALDFALDNNLPGIIDALKNEGFTVSTKGAAKATLLSLMKDDKQRAIAIISSVPYDNANTNYTGGFIDFFTRTTPAYMQNPQSRDSRFMWTGLLAGIGAGLQAFTSFSSVQGQFIQPANNAAKAAQEEEERKKKEEEERKKKNMWLIIGGLFLLIILIIILYFAFRPKKTNN